MTTQRVQLALNVHDIDEAVAYYSKLFGVDVNKRKPGYANFAVDNPPLKLVLFENDNAERINHLGVECLDQIGVDDAITRLTSAGIAEELEEQETCCFATQNKVWSTEPQGLRWEFYKVLEDSETFFAEENATAPARDEDASQTSTCC